MRYYWYTIIYPGVQWNCNPQVAPLPPSSLRFRMCLFNSIFLRKMPSPNETERRRLDMGSGEHLTQNLKTSGANDIMTSVTSCSSWLHAGCEHSPALPQVILQLLIQRQGTEITAVNVLPGTMCAAASSMLSSLGTDRHKLIQFSN